MSLLSRRSFLQSTAAIGASTIFGVPNVIANRAALDKLRIGMIGTSNRAEANWRDCLAAGVEIVSFADVDDSKTANIRQAAPKAIAYTDFRKLLDAKGIDALVVGTPDHTHFHPAYYALQSGLHVYCEKPLTHDVWEARTLSNLAKKNKLVTQMGTQIHAGDNYRRVVEVIQSGMIGTVSEVHVWCGKSWGGNGKRPVAQEVPKGLDWDLWLGPVKERPYSSEYHPFNWRKFWDFGGGTLADMACHHMDLPFWALKLRHPTKISAEGDAPSPETAAGWVIAKYEYAALGELPPVSLTWYDGGKRPKIMSDPSMPKWGDGSLFVGSKGMLLADYGRMKLLPEKTFANAPLPPKSIPNSIGHHKEWVEACKNNGTTTCNFDYSGALTEAVLLGVVSYRTGKTLEWDPASLQVTNSPEAQSMLRREYRKGWEV
jgi:predicted dehydrogenase